VGTPAAEVQIMKVTPETKKQRLIADLAEARSALLQAALFLPPVAQDTPFLGAWSAHDIVAHLIGWDHANLEAIEAVLAGRLPAFYAAYDPDWRSFNTQLVRQHKQPSLAATLAAAQASHLALLDRLEALPAGDMLRDAGVRSPRGRRVTIGMLLTAEAGDERKHADQIRTFALRF